jgi:SAM-dependent methyltransferase
MAQVSSPHPLFPHQSADERARHGFLVEFKRLLGSRYRENIRRSYEKTVLPDFLAQVGRAPQTRAEAKALLHRDEYFRLWTALARAQHQGYVDSTGACVERQAETLSAVARAVARSASRGPLRLDESLNIPAYQSELDVHCVPGGYFVELGADDVYAGARYELGITLFTLGAHGYMNDSKGIAGVNFLRQRFPQFTPQRVLELGCTAGNSTLPYVDAWPEAEVHGIDLSAPCLRYAHARSELLGRAVHYSQQNAESTAFPTGHFDLVVSHILLHELSAEALPRVFAECRRLLRPGGVMLHVEVPVRYSRLDAFEQALSDWDTDFNNEPFWEGLHATDLAAVAREVGFGSAEIFDVDLDPTLMAFINRQPWMAFGARLPKSNGQ